MAAARLAGCASVCVGIAILLYVRRGCGWQLRAFRVQSKEKSEKKKSEKRKAGKKKEKAREAGGKEKKREARL